MAQQGLVYVTDLKESMDFQLSKPYITPSKGSEQQRRLVFADSQGALWRLIAFRPENKVDRSILRQRSRFSK